MQRGSENPVTARDSLLRAARDVFFEDGYQKASLRKIGKLAGTSQTAIYYYFVDKQDVLFTLIDDFTNHFANKLTTTFASGRNPREQLANMISAQLDLLLENSKDIKILSQDKGHLSEIQQRLIRSKEKTVVTIYRACLNEWRKAGGLTGIDSTVAAFTVIGAINWLYQWYSPDGLLSWETVKKSMVRQLLQGFGESADGKPAFEEVGVM